VNKKVLSAGLKIDRVADQYCLCRWHELLWSI